MTMQTGDHSGSIPVSVRGIDCATPPVTATATAMIAAQTSADCNSMEPNFTNVSNSVSVMPNSMPSFFANPFMTPFMPQQAAITAIPMGNNSGTVESTQLTGPESGDYRSNPLQTGNYVMQSLQCQEMMQRYIQSLIAAASHLPGSNISSDGAITTTVNQQSLDDSKEQSSGDSGHFQIDFPNALPALLQSMQQQLYLNSPAVSQYANSVPNLDTDLTTSNVIRKIDDEKEKVSESKSFTVNDDASEEIRNEPQQMIDCNVAIPEQQNGIINANEISQDSENNHSIDIPSSNDVGKCSSTSNDENSIKEENTKKGKNSDIMIKELSSVNSSKISETIPFKTSTSSSSSSFKNIPETSLSSSSNGNSGTNTVQEECRTSVLIKKQMNEIDKEINRRIQNRNIKKSVLPFGAAEIRKSDTSTPKPTLEQLRNSFALPVVSSNSNFPSLSTQSSSSSSSSYHYDHYPQQQQFPSLHLGVSGGPSADTTSMVPSQNCCSASLPTTMEQFTTAAAAAAAAFGTISPQSYPQFQSYFPPPPPSHAYYFPGTHQHISPQLAAAILQQSQHGQAMNVFSNLSFPLSQSSSSVINGNNLMAKVPENDQHVAISMDTQTTTSTMTADITVSNGDCLGQKIPSPLSPPPPPPPPLPSSSSSSSSASSSSKPVPSLSLSLSSTTTTTTLTSTSVNMQQKLLTQQRNDTEMDHHQHRKYSLQTASQNNWPGETDWMENGRHILSKENTMKNVHPEEISAEGEPVWVMRDSYLKRVQREENQSNEEIMEMNKNAEKLEPTSDEAINETESLLSKDEQGGDDGIKTKKGSKKEVIVHEPAVLIEGVLFRARYLGSTQLICEGRPTKASRMMQAQEAVARVKAPAGEIQPSTDIDLFISTEKIMVLNTDLQRISDTDVRQDILMDHALRTISYIADIGDLVVLMARRMSQSSKEESFSISTPRVICHVFESDEASFIAQSIGQAFQVAYVEFLRANGIDDPSYLREIDYQEVLSSQELMGDELEMFAKKEAQKDVVVPKKAGEPLGVVVVESGWGSMLPTVVIANLQPNGAACRCNHLNIGDQIIAINGISLVGLPLASAQQNIKATKSSTAVKLTVVSTPPVVEVRIRRPDTKYQLGFSVQNGVICSLLRGGIAERGGIRVGHRIIEINSQSVVAVPHERIVNMLASAIGEIHMKTMPTSMFRLLTGQEVPNYI